MSTPSPAAAPPPVILSLGFRPFFLLAGLHAALSMALWVVWLGTHLMNAAIIDLSIAGSPYVWHGHEMVFGFLTAAIAGFLLTATPNWTGTPPITGTRLAVLVAAWLAGRVGLWCSAWLPVWMVIGLDALFLPLLAIMLAMPLIRAGKRANMMFIALIFMMAVGGLLSNLGSFGFLEDGGRMGRLIGIDVAVMMMVVVGGRVTPAFSRNWLNAKGKVATDIAAPRWLERPAIGFAALALLAELTPLPASVPAILMVVAGILLLARLWCWRPWRVTAEPLLWVLSLGALWVAAGFILRGAAVALPMLSETAALHGHAIGAAGTMIAGIMTRASLGHTGRSLIASPLMILTYGFVTTAAVTRILGPTLLPDLTLESLVLAGCLWIIAFLLFVVEFAPILLSPRK